MNENSEHYPIFFPKFYSNFAVFFFAKASMYINCLFRVFAILINILSGSLEKTFTGKGNNTS